ncbi:MAG: phenylacetate--CoA ligase [Chloroflexi bacterium]|nr:phenylacetate--CoA ligase [Chloroflexota bacterium]
MTLREPVYPAPPQSFKIERAERGEILAIQQAGLQRLVERSWQKIPFYRSKWEAARVEPRHVKSVDDVRLLPIVTKSELEDHLASNPPFGQHQGRFRALRIQASSGSTGKPKPFFQTRRDWQNITNFWARRLYAQGVRRGDMVQISFTYALFIPGFTASEGAMRLGATVIPVGSGAVTSSERQIEIARDWGSTVLGCTGTYALRLADVAESMGYDTRRDFYFRRMFHTAEPLTEESRQRIQERWNVKAFNNYGSVETGAPTWECEEQDGMHINEDGYIFEIVDPDTNEPLPDGEYGALVITSLFKEAGPVIRYKIGDIASIIPGKCRCGRTFRRLSPVKGRLDHMVKIKGIAVYPTAIEAVLRGFSDLGSNYLIVIESKDGQDEITVQAERVDTGSAPPDLAEKVVQELKAKVGVTCRVEMFPAGGLGQGQDVDRWIKSKRLIDKRQKV